MPVQGACSKPSAFRQQASHLARLQGCRHIWCARRPWLLCGTCATVRLLCTLTCCLLSAVCIIRIVGVMCMCGRRWVYRTGRVQKAAAVPGKRKRSVFWQETLWTRPSTHLHQKVRLLCFSPPASAVARYFSTTSGIDLKRSTRTRIATWTLRSSREGRHLSGSGSVEKRSSLNSVSVTIAATARL